MPDEQQTAEGRPDGPNTEPAKKNIEIPPIPKETAGTVLGAAVGALAGQAGAVVGGVIGAIAGKAAASGRPVMPASTKGAPDAATRKAIRPTVSGLTALQSTNTGWVLASSPATLSAKG